MHQQGEKGYILMEVLIATVMGVVVLNAIFGVCHIMERFCHEAIQQTEIQYAVRNVMQLLYRDIKSSQEFTVSEDGTILYIKSSKGDQIRYYVKNNKMYKYHNAGIPVADYINKVSFQMNDGGMLLVNLEAEGEHRYYQLSLLCSSLLTP